MVWRLALVICASWLVCCGPGSDKRQCPGPHPDFNVTLRLSNRPLPPDTVVRVTYGGSGMEAYTLAAPGANHEVVFCSVADADGVPLESSSSEGAGAKGEEERSVFALSCALWTGGFTTVEVRGSGIESTSHDLLPREGGCTVARTIVLDSLDAG